MDNLPELKDIHLPPPIPDYHVPLILAVAIIALALIIAGTLFASSKFFRIRRKLWQLKKEQNFKIFLEKLSEALKEHFETQTLFQKKWKKYLEEKGLPKETAALLSEELYKKKIPTGNKNEILKEIIKII